MVARQIQEQEQRQVQPKKRIRRIRTTVTLGERMIIGFMAIMTFVVLGIIVHNFASIYSVNQEVHKLEGDISKQVEVNEGLSLQVVELSAPDRILSIAKELGMSLDENKVKVVQQTSSN
ncbi:cell division protein FtsL [Bacillus suaedae]|uniref:Cell division protein FtsL n=1 Tax=Halalkalibacter suaedae TaxID=2822140 RepID=A0A940WX17_9BACI|nr:cell division protein FtsL [Bacillus suaedae]MBP3952132.1 cell division protein FtsL [Bacillus suaedae]